jgi:multicomponent Na+:H+ antiporter subunit D
VSWTAMLPLLVIGSSLTAAVLIFPLGEERERLRATINITAAVVKLLFVALMVLGGAQGLQFETHLAFLPGIPILLRADFLGLLFVSLSAVLWLVTTVYALAYLRGSPDRSRFFGFFSLCVTATMGIALAGNLVTFFVFYELLTIATYPLVVHRGTGRALAAGRLYLVYTLTGGIVLLLGITLLHVVLGVTDFVPGGGVAVAATEAAASRGMLVSIFALLIGGLGVKAALFPLHGWLPQAMVAPAPVSALLHAVAVVKAGAFGIVRVVYDVFGLEFAAGLGVLGPLAIIASVSIVYGSLRALAQDDLKKRLAFSTVSQLAYITLGTALVGPLSTMGGLVHLVHQGIMKITLFLCAGVLAETLGLHNVSELRGVGRRMPLTMLAFTIAAFGMIGVPPLAGFVTKWYIGIGAVDAGAVWAVGVLVLSSVLSALYFLPIIRTAWFDEPDGEWTPRPAGRRLEGDPALVISAIVPAVLTLGAGLLAGFPWSPLSLARLAVEGIYLR